MMSPVPGPPRTTAVARRAARVSAGAILAGLGLVILFANATIREWETVVSGTLGGLVTGSRSATWAEGHTFYVGIGSHVVRGMRITSECTVALMIGPLLLAGGVVLATARVAARRAVGGVLAGAALLIVANSSRIALVTAAAYFWGSGGYGWSHIAAGSAISVLASVLGIAVFLRFAFDPGAPAREPRRSER